MIYIMRRNEAKKFLLQKADDYYSHRIGWDEFNSIEIAYIPLDLDRYDAIRPETKKWINILFSEESTDKKGRYMLRGFTRRESSEMEAMNLLYGDYSRNNNFWAYNDEERLIYTFCEGDTTLQMFTNELEYLQEKENNILWYSKN